MTMECVNGCGFFGSAETRNMCSKCFKDFVKTQAITSNKPISGVDSLDAKVRDLGGKILKLISAVDRVRDETWYDVMGEVSKITERYSKLDAAVRRGDRIVASGSDVEVEMSEITAIISKLMSAVDLRGDEKMADSGRMEGVDELMEKMKGLRVNVKVNRNRCECCKKKVGLLGFECRCGGVFCGQHRMPELHTCNVDYKESKGSNTNPHLTLIKPDKLEFRI